MQHRRRKLAWAILIGGTAITAVAVYGVLSREAINPDPFMFGIAAKRLLAGQRLYVDFFEAKPPLTTLLYAVPGFLCPRSYLAVSWFLAALLLVQSSLWLWVFRPRLPTAAACLWFVVLFPATFWDFAWASGEHFSNLFVTVVLLASYVMFRDGQLRGWHCLAAGAAVCLAFHCRQNTVLCALVPLAVVLAARAAWSAKTKALLWFGVGGIAAWAAVLGLVLVVSDPKDYFYQTFVFPALFARSGVPSGRFNLIVGFAQNPLPALLGLAAGLALLGRHRRLAMIAFPVGLLYCVMSPHPHWHYWVNLFPFVTLGLLLGLPREEPTTPFLERVAVAVIGVCVLAGLPRLVPHLLNVPKTALMDEVAVWIDDRAGPGDTLYVYGPMGSEYVQFRSRLLPANKYTVAWEIDRNDGMAADSFEAILHGYLQRPPTYFVVHEGEMAMIEAARSKKPADVARSVRLGLELMNRHPYERVKTLNDYHVHVLREAGPSDMRKTRTDLGR